MPQQGKQAQFIRLHLGDVYLAMGDVGNGRILFEKVRDGKDPLLQKLARERLLQAEINSTIFGGDKE